MPANCNNFVRTLLRWGSTPISPRRPDLLSFTRVLLLLAICFDIGLTLLQGVRIAIDTPRHIAAVTAITYVLPPWRAGEVFPLSFVAGLTILMVFVLARIFESGSRMRTELQETV